MTAQRRLLFITGRLAERPLRRVVADLADQFGFRAQVQVLPITVAALMTPDWIARHLEAPADADELWIPGYCQGDLTGLQQRARVPVHRGPRDLYDLPRAFGQPAAGHPDYGGHGIQILAEINHAPRLPLDQIRQQALQLRADGADVIDVGCLPGGGWSQVGPCVRMLRDSGLRVSIDSLDPTEIAQAVAAGAELVLSVNRSNREAARDWGAEVVAIPDDPRSLSGLEETVEYLERHGVPLCVDPILEPIGCGFAASLGRYIDIRHRYPQLPMLMGIGNLTELTDSDSAGINTLLLGVCQELAIDRILTTQVIHWARTSVRECDLARKLVHYAVHHSTPAKHLEPQLVPLRGTHATRRTPEELQELAGAIRDRNFRIYLSDHAIHILSAGLHLSGDDPYDLLRQLLAAAPPNLDPAHAFYLGYELSKARTALTLDKEYVQDEALTWGYLTVPETRGGARHARGNKTK